MHRSPLQVHTQPGHRKHLNVLDNTTRARPSVKLTVSVGTVGNVRRRTHSFVKGVICLFNKVTSPTLCTNANINTSIVTNSKSVHIRHYSQCFTLLRQQLPLSVHPHPSHHLSSVSHPPPPPPLLSLPHINKSVCSL